MKVINQSIIFKVKKIHGRNGNNGGFIISLGFLQMYLLYKCGYNFKYCKRWHVLYVVMDLNVWGIYIMSV